MSVIVRCPCSLQHMLLCCRMSASRVGSCPRQVCLNVLLRIPLGSGTASGAGFLSLKRIITAWNGRVGKPPMPSAPALFCGQAAANCAMACAYDWFGPVSRGRSHLHGGQVHGGLRHASCLELGGKDLAPLRDMKRCSLHAVLVDIVSRMKRPPIIRTSTSTWPSNRTENEIMSMVLPTASA